MTELVYDNKEIEKIILKKYSKAIIEDASDYIHEERFSVSIENVSKEEFWEFANENKFLTTCLGFLISNININT